MLALKPHRGLGLRTPPHTPDLGFSEASLCTHPHPSHSQKSLFPNYHGQVGSWRHTESNVSPLGSRSVVSPVDFPWKETSTCDRAGLPEAEGPGRIHLLGGIQLGQTVGQERWPTADRQPQDWGPPTDSSGSQGVTSHCGRSVVKPVKFHLPPVSCTAFHGPGRP